MVRRPGQITNASGGDPLAAINTADASKPFVVAQLGQSLDGRIALPSGESRWINGPQARDHLHALRAACDAVVVGSGTVLADDPQLNVRRCPGTNPARVVIDPNGRTPPEAKIFANDGAPRFVISKSERSLPSGVTGIAIEPRNGAIDPTEIVEALNERGMKRLLIEGGANTISLFLKARAIDRLHLLLAPMLLGDGKQGISFPSSDNLADALTPHASIYVLDGGDVLFDCDLRTPA